MVFDGYRFGVNPIMAKLNDSLNIAYAKYWQYSRAFASNSFMRGYNVFSVVNRIATLRLPRRVEIFAKPVHRRIGGSVVCVKYTSAGIS